MIIPSAVFMAVITGDAFYPSDTRTPGLNVSISDILEPHYCGVLHLRLVALRRGVIEVADGGTGNSDAD